MLPWPADLAGRIDQHIIASEAVRGNPLGDPRERPLWVQVPAAAWRYRLSLSAGARLAARA